MKDLINNNELTMSSREIAELTGKSIGHIHRDLKVMFESLYETPNPDLDQVTFEYDVQGRITLIHLDEEHSMNLVTGYNAKLRMAVIKRWKELESKQLQPALPANYIEALESLVVSEKEKAVLSEQLQIAQPKIAFVDNYTKADTGSKGFREVCKLLKVKENEFRKFLTGKKIMYKLAGAWTAYQNHIDAGRFEVKTGETNGHVHNTTKFTGKGISWIAGLYAQHQISEK